MTPNDIAAVKKELREKVDAANRGLEYGITLHIDAFLTILDSHDKLEAELQSARDAFDKQIAGVSQSYQQALAENARLRERLEAAEKELAYAGASLLSYEQSHGTGRGDEEAYAIAALLGYEDERTPEAVSEWLLKYAGKEPTDGCLDSHDKLEAENKALLADVAALRAPLEQIRNSMCSIGLSLPPLLQSVEQMLDSPNPGQALLDERDTLAAENALLRGRLEAAEKVVSAAEKHRDDVRMCCPECGSEEFFQRPYDFGRDPETGYHDSGVRATCHKCSHDADIEDFQHLELAQGIRHWLSVYLAKYTTPKEPTDA